MCVGGLLLRQSVATSSYNPLQLAGGKITITHVRRVHGLLGLAIWSGARFTVGTGALMDNLRYGPYTLVFLIAETCAMVGAVFALELRAWKGRLYQNVIETEFGNQIAIKNRDTDKKKDLLLSEKIKDWEGKKIFFFKNSIVELDKMFIHPGGQWIVKYMMGREVSRYIYGVSPLERANNSAWNHTLSAAKYLSNHTIGSLFNPMNTNEWILHEAGSDVASYSKCTIWKLTQKNCVHKEIFLLDFKSNKFEFEAMPTGVLYFGKHYIVTNSKKARIYTSCISLNEELNIYRTSLLNYLRQDLDISTIQTPPNRLSSLRFLVKCLDSSHALSRELKLADIGKGFKIEGPFGQGLDLTPSTSGKIALLFSGTGIAPFIELFDFLLRKMIYIQLQSEGRDTSVVYPLQNYESILTDVQFEAFGAFRSPNEFVGASWISEIVSLSRSTTFGLKSFTVRARGEGLSPLFRITTKSYNSSFFRSEGFERFDRIYVCGGQPFNFSVHSGLIKAGVDDGKITIL